MSVPLQALQTAQGTNGRLAEFTSIPGVVGAAYNGKVYGSGGWIQVVVSSNEGIRLLQRDMNTSKYGYESFPTAYAEELQGAIKDYIKEYLTESKEGAAPPPQVRGGRLSTAYCE